MPRCRDSRSSYCWFVCLSGTVGLGPAGRGAADLATSGRAVAVRSTVDETVQAGPQVAIGFHVKTLPNKSITTIAGIDKTVTMAAIIGYNNTIHLETVILIPMFSRRGV